MKTTRHIKAVYRYLKNGRLVYDIIYQSGRLKTGLLGYELSAAVYRVLWHSVPAVITVDYPYSDNGQARIFWERGRD